MSTCLLTMTLQVHLPSAADVLNLSPISSLVATLPCRGVIATAAAAPSSQGTTASVADAIPAGVDFVTRFFAPQCGIDEVRRQPVGPLL